jgi:hypothetical protein
MTCLSISWHHGLGLLVIGYLRLDARGFAEHELAFNLGSNGCFVFESVRVGLFGRNLDRNLQLDGRVANRSAGYLV